jgi:cytochrome P450
VNSEWQSVRTNGGEPRTAPGPDTLLSLQEIQQDPLAFLSKLSREYGDVCSYRTDHWQVVLLNHPAYIKHVLQDHHRNYVKTGTPDLMMLKPMLGDGLMTSEGDAWLSQRRLLQPAFHREQVEAFGRLMVEITLDLCADLRQYANRAQPIDIAEQMTRLTTRIVARALYGADIVDQLGNFSESVQRMNEFMAHYDPRDRARYQQFRHAHAAIHQIVEHIIRARRGRSDSGHDLLAMLMRAQDEQTGQGMNDAQLRDQVMTLLMAGHETTAKALTWTWYLLDRHPVVAQRLRAEHAAVLGGRPPTIQDLPSLEYTWMVLQEAMRLYPPVWIMSRRAVVDDVIGEYRVPAGSLVLVSPYLIHRHAEYWPNPERFDPERFRAGQSADRPHYALFSFSGGPRQCIGKSFATVELQLVLATIAQHYTLQLVPDYRVEPEALVTLCPRGGLPMTLHTNDDTIV